MRPAANSAGWQVERLTARGWVAVSAPFATRKQALAALSCCDPADGEHRVYEALHPRGVRLPEPAAVAQ